VDQGKLRVSQFLALAGRVCAFTHSKGEILALIEYIKGQAEHHRRTTFAEEYRKLLLEAGIEFDERYIL
jgi:predicted nucleotidyltransferase